MESKLLIIFNIFLLVQLSTSADLTFKQLQTCQQYKTDAHDYLDFFNISSIMDSELSEFEYLNLRFYVQTYENAHILLSKERTAESDEKLYEIVLGASGNTFSTIRLKPKHETVIMVDGPVGLDTFMPLSIRVKLTKDGSLKVYVSNKEYMSYYDEDIKDIPRFVSLASYASVPATWFYNCKFTESNDF